MRLQQIHSKQEIRQFIQAAWDIQGGQEAWVPPLRLQQMQLLSSAHPFWEKNDRLLLLASKNGKTLGRLAVFNNLDHNTHFEEQTAFFGFFDCVEKADVAQALLEEAAAWAKRHGFRQLRGPFNPSIHDETGILVKGFHRQPYLMTSYNPPYYEKLMVDNGFVGVKDFYAFHFAPGQYQEPERMQKVRARLQASGRWQLRHPSKRKWKREIPIIEALYNHAQLGQWGFYPLPQKDFRQLAADLRQIIDTQLVTLIEREGEAVAFGLALPDFNELFSRIPNGKLLPFGWMRLLIQRPRSVRVILAGVQEEYRHMGLGALLFHEMASKILHAGYWGGEVSWVMEGNDPMHKAAEFMNAKHDKTWRVYERQL